MFLGGNPPPIGTATGSEETYRSFWSYLNKQIKYVSLVVSFYSLQSINNRIINYFICTFYNPFISGIPLFCDVRYLGANTQSL